MSPTTQNMLPTISLRRSWPMCATLALAFASVAAIAPLAEAQQVFWTGVSGTLWSAASGTNWSSTAASPGTPTVPVSSGSLALNWRGAFGTNKNTYNDISNLSAASISMNNGNPTGYTLNGLPVTLTAATAINATGTGSNTINLDLVANVASFFIQASTGGGNLTINGVISETGGSRELQIGYGSATLTGNNSISGPVRLGVGNSATTFVSVNKLDNIGVAQPLGTGTTIQFGHNSSAGSGFVIYTGSTAASTNKVFQIGTAAGGKGGGFTNNGTGVVTWSGTQNTAGASGTSVPFTLAGSNTGDNTWQSRIANNTSSGTVSITKDGAGKWVLSGSNSYTGATTVSAGTLLVNGNQSGAVGAVSVAANAILGGTGTLGGVSAAITGTVAPGLSGSLGTLTFAGSAMNFSSGGSLLAQLNSNPAVFTSDLLAISGAGSLTLGGSSILDLFGPGSFTTSGTYTLATFASGSSVNQFTTVRYNGQTFGSPTTTGGVNSNGTLVYNADSIQLVVVPEPGTLVLAGLGVGLAGFTAWKRRRRA